jgi:hypothetical protein
MLTKKQQQLLVLIMREGSINRADAKPIYSNQRSFYSAMKYLKDVGLTGQRGGKGDRDNEPTYELTLSGMVFTIMLANIKISPEKMKEMNDL